MSHARIIKQQQQKISPHLRDYESTTATFRWEEAKKEVMAPGPLNIAFQVLDRHLGTPTETKTALNLVDDTLGEQKFTFGDLIRLTNRFANVLKTLGVQKGDRVFTFLPRIPELYVSFLGAMKTGAIASNMFAAFGKEALKDRLADSQAKVLVTTPELLERLKDIRDQLPHLEHIVVVGEDFQEKMDAASDEYVSESMSPEDPSYMLYTSGTTGKPKGVVHSHGDFVQQYLTGKWILDFHEEDMYWCTADPGWVTGVVYGIISPWANGMTQIVHGGRFDAGSWYDIVQKYRVTIWYTSPTAIRMLMTTPELLKEYDMSSLRHMASVGEPLNPEAIVWAQKYLDLPIHDNYWQTETGSIVIANYPSMDIKPGSMGKPFPGIHAGIIDEAGNELEANQEGQLALRPDFPSLMKSIWNNEEKFQSYFLKPSVIATCPESSIGIPTSQEKQSEPQMETKGWYLTGDRARRDEEGYVWFIGRSDDIIKTAGERIGPFEVESALLEHPAVAEAGVIGKPDELRGEIIKAFIKLKPDFEMSEGDDRYLRLKEEIQQFIKKELAGHAYPREIEFVEKLPKTRSGKIMRRVLKLQEMGQDVGDTSTMEEY